MKKILMIGSGFAGAVIADVLSQKKNPPEIVVLDERSHVGGNCYTERDASTGVMVHKYGPHIFHTSNAEVWEYVNRFVKFRPFVNRVKALYRGNIYSLPINLHTINQFYGKSMNPVEAKKWIEKEGDISILEPKNLEEQAIKFLGEKLYKAFFYGYTKKQWGCEPFLLPASILKRLPVRFNYDDNYYNDLRRRSCGATSRKNERIGRKIWKRLEFNGTKIIERMLDHPNIKVELGRKWSSKEDITEYDHVFYSGPIDEFFDCKYGRLGYRTVYFQREETEGDFQGNPVINYCDENVPWTRIHEHKHFTPWEKLEKTVYFKEFSKETEETDIPYYPKRLESDMEIYEQYAKEAQSLKNITFVGRLATYRYMDMHHVIEESLEIAKKFM